VSEDSEKNVGGEKGKVQFKRALTSKEMLANGIREERGEKIGGSGRCGRGKNR